MSVIAAVDLGRSPTSGCSDWRTPGAASIRPAPGRAPWRGTRMVGSPQSSPGRRRDIDELGRRELVHEPVVHHELNPGRRQQVQNGRRLERVARHELPADDAWVGNQEVRACRGTCARAGHCGRTGGPRRPSVGNFRSLSVPSTYCGLPHGRIEIRRDLAPRRAAVLPCRAGSSRAARCACRSTGAWPATAAACTTASS